MSVMILEMPLVIFIIDEMARNNEENQFGLKVRAFIVPAGSTVVALS
ncbi:hypothetical protein ACF3NG_00870 [Aerococcaceae bacterium WGS1372]